MALWQKTPLTKGIKTDQGKGVISKTYEECLQIYKKTQPTKGKTDKIMIGKFTKEIKPVHKNSKGK